ncbi:MAG: PEP-CTERM sorting domain-containing protein [Planctomycetota bacterium]|jgi:hypothetical protein
MKSKGLILILLVTMCWLLFWPLRADATLVTIEIEAIVDEVTDPHNFLEGKVEVGDTITGSYVYDSSTPDSNPIQDYAAYWHYSAPAGIYLAVGGLEFKTDPDYVNYRFAISNGYQSVDTYSIRSINNLPLPNGTLVDNIFWFLQDSTGTAVSTVELPTCPPVLDDWQLNDLRIRRERAFEIQGHVTSAVPEPATILLFGLGGLALLRKGKRVEK